MDHELIERLRRLRGIERSFTDFRGRTRIVEDASVLRLLAAFGHDVNDPGALRREAEELERREWVRVVPPVLILRKRTGVPVTLIAPLPHRIAWRIELEDGGRLEGEFLAGNARPQDERGVDGLWYQRVELELPELPSGYHRLELSMTDGRPLGSARLIAAPECCFEPDAIREGRRLWGPAVQLYTLRSARNWGIGDFTDLEGFVSAAAALGADLVGLNPLHALFPSDPALAAPYSPASRNFLNILYIDPEALPEFGRSSEARALVGAPGFQARLAALRASDRVDYAGVAECKLTALWPLYQEFQRSASRLRRRVFEQFVKNAGQELEILAVFYAAQARLLEGGVVGGWTVWPAEWQDPGSAAVRELRAAEAEAVRFHCWLQWVADCQLMAARETARMEGMAVGLYVDLAVGANGGGAEVWGAQSLHARGATIGAPPDPLALQGQDWGIPPMRPDELRERGYEPFVRLLRANMAQGGALRIDHVMALLRLWWVPAGQPSSEGSYVRYPLEDLMAIVALESQRNRCLVIGEDLGTVPPEIRKAMADHGVYSYRVLFFEKDAEGSFIPPDAYPEKSLATPTTHDLPTLASFWAGSDIELRETLGLYPEPEMAADAWAVRAADRADLAAAMVRLGLLPRPQDPGAAASIPMSLELVRAIECYLAGSRAGILAVQPEDWLLMDAPVNVPGTHVEYSNWSRKLDAEWPEFMARAEVQEVARAVDRARRASEG
jgi:4-alpha-glucanotransferase